MVLFGLAIYAFSAQAMALGTASLSVTPATGSYNKDATVAITLKENSTDQVNAVQANLVYDQSKLQFVSIDISSSPFNFPYATTGGSGKVSIASTVTAGGSVTGLQTVGTVTFKVLVGSGSTAITFAADSAIVRLSDGQNVWNGTATGATYTLTTPAVPATPPATTTTTPTTSTGTTKTNTTANTTPTTTSAPKTSVTTATPTPTVLQQQADPSKPVAVQAGQINQKGYFVAVKIVDLQGKAISGAVVTIGNQKAKTDNTGIASFNGISAGTHTITTKTSKGSVKGTVVVNSNKLPTEVQQYTLTLKPENLTVLYAGLGALVAIVIGFVLFKIIKGRGGKSGGYNTVSGFTPEPPTPIQSNVSQPAVQSSSTMDTLDKIQVDVPRPATVIHPTQVNPSTPQNTLNR